MIDRTALEDLRRVVGEWVSEHCSGGSVGEVEELADEVARACGAGVVEQLLPLLGGKASYQKSSQPCTCGRKAKFVGYRQRGVGTVHGVVQVSRAYYYCKHCRRGSTPWDASQGLNARLWTPRVKALVAQVAGRLPYQESVDLLEKLVGLRIEDSSAEEVTVEVGGRMRDEESALIAGVESGEITPVIAQAPGRLYVGMDGASAHIDGTWHEVKAGVIYEGKAGEDGIDRAQRARYVGAQEPAERFGSRLYLAAAQAGVQVAKQVVVIGDGAEWIWNLADHHYQGATQIVDVWHACEHIHALAHAYYGPESPRGKRWAKDHCRGLKAHGPGRLLGALKRMKPKSHEQAESVRRETGYFTRNRDRMQYPQYRKQGMMIGSGPVEAACKVLVGQRLKGAGMRWSGRGADAILSVRAALLSNQTQLIDRAATAA